MEIKTHFTKTIKTARFSTLGNLSSRTKYLWIALHGSKMRCEQMLFKFKDFDNESHFFIAPEGLNRQYENGFGGDVVASWMTKRDRLHEINDFSMYLSGILDTFQKQISENTKIIVLGFSQGGTSVFRWLHNTKIKVDHFIAYSCWIPEDIDIRNGASNFDDIDLIYTYGEQDEFLNEKIISQLKEIIEKNNLTIQISPYKGTHRIDRQQLTSLFESYIKK